jgi:hypothetical protein
MTNPRPLAVTLIAWVYIVMGAVGFVYHARELMPPISRDSLLVEPVRLIAIVCGIYLLRGRNWARWLTVVWMAYHVVLSLFHSADQVAVHSVFLAAIAYLLFFRPEANRFFRAG